ncbi:hypothetical protein CBS101457_000435 [Exobasidium rhododendri]|nr:hypothetical protein CBS101457_000435 [Exobasidium rhododendri]
MSNSLSVEQLRIQLEALGVDSRGHRNELRSRLKKKQQQQGHFQRNSQRRDKEPSIADVAPSWRRAEAGSRVAMSSKPEVVETIWQPKVESYLVLDVEATCQAVKAGQPRKSSFEFPNEIIEIPIILLQWRTLANGSKELYKKDIFHTYVKPVWRPHLTQFCRDLTGITQDEIDSAPNFAEAVDLLHAFLASHELLEAGVTRQILTRRARSAPSPFLRKGVCWVTHGPFDLLHFVVKQSFISGLTEGVPSFLRGPLIDVKLAALALHKNSNGVKTQEAVSENGYPFRDTTVDGLLALLQLEPFQGRHHCGLDDTKNIARIFISIASRVAELAVQRGWDEDEDAECPGTVKILERLTLLPNTSTEKAHLRRWDWMCNKELGKVNWLESEDL